MKEWSVYQEANKEKFLEELLALLRIPSVSAKSEHNADIWLAQMQWSNL